MVVYSSHPLHLRIQQQASILPVASRWWSLPPPPPRLQEQFTSILPACSPSHGRAVARRWWAPPLPLSGSGAARGHAPCILPLSGSSSRSPAASRWWTARLASRYALVLPLLFPPLSPTDSYLMAALLPASCKPLHFGVILHAISM